MKLADRPKQSARQLVKKVYPKAYSVQYKLVACVYEKPVEAGKRGQMILVNLLGTGRTARQAWAKAAANLPKGGKKR
ncbi:hypothetical protein UFOVP1670_61 [uncultured Caudovirales phage]|uniref:Uncharacterized protein n=1 Tax=uncultured Caudovirales phage TaxID=2100421 RepID=A0A6J5T7D4_9CAUD|nr:hypothetical protein UFOVP1670_61 [uncultured Caudovirales phage]